MEKVPIIIGGFSSKEIYRCLQQCCICYVAVESWIWAGTYVKTTSKIFPAVILCCNCLICTFPSITDRCWCEFFCDGNAIYDFGSSNLVPAELVLVIIIALNMPWLENYRLTSSVQSGIIAGYYIIAGIAEVLPPTTLLSMQMVWYTKAWSVN